MSNVFRKAETWPMCSKPTSLCGWAQSLPLMVLGTQLPLLPMVCDFTISRQISFKQVFCSLTFFMRNVIPKTYPSGNKSKALFKFITALAGLKVYLEWRQSFPLSGNAHKKFCLRRFLFLNQHTVVVGSSLLRVYSLAATYSKGLNHTPSSLVWKESALFCFVGDFWAWQSSCRTHLPPRGSRARGCGAEKSRTTSVGTGIPSLHFHRLRGVRSSKNLLSISRCLETHVQFTNTQH